MYALECLYVSMRVGEGRGEFLNECNRACEGRNRGVYDVQMAWGVFVSTST